MRLQDYRGKTKPYCTLEIAQSNRFNGMVAGGVRRRTAVARSDSTPMWDEGFPFEVSAKQSAESSLLVKAWGKDNNGSDDFLGAVPRPTLSR